MVRKERMSFTVREKEILEKGLSSLIIVLEKSGDFPEKQEYKHLHTKVFRWIYEREDKK